MDFPSFNNHFQEAHADLLRSSYKHWTGSDLVSASLDPKEGARALFEAPFVLLSHNTAPEDPILNYSNRTGLKVFELTWRELVVMPSRLTAEPLERLERARLMKAVSDHGFIDDYSGIRVSSTGKRFFIERATVWNLIDYQGIYQGQAAMFTDWIPVAGTTQAQQPRVRN